VFDVDAPAPKRDHPVVPPSMSGFVNRFPLAAAAGAPWADATANDASARTTARPNERIVIVLFLFIPFS
jgi:hypothetical protein